MALRTWGAGDAKLFDCIKAGNYSAAHLRLNVLFDITPDVLNGVGDDGKCALELCIERSMSRLFAVLIVMGTEYDRCLSNGQQVVARLIQQREADMLHFVLESSPELGQVVADDGNTSLHCLAHRDDVEAMREALTTLSQFANVANVDGDFPLHIASRRGNARMVEHLIEAGAHVDAATTVGSTALHQAVANGHASVVKKLLVAGANVDAQTKRGATPLMLAAHGGHLQLIHMLLRRGANITVVTSSGSSACAYALRQGDTNSAWAMYSTPELEAVLAFAPEASPPLRWSLKRLTEPRPSSTSHQAPDWNMPVSIESIDSVKRHRCLVGDVINVRPHVPSRLIDCLGEDATFLREFLLRARTPNLCCKIDEWYCIIHAAAAAGNLPNVEVLVNNGADVNVHNARQATPLVLALLHGHYSVADLLAKRGADVDQITSYQTHDATPLMVHASSGNAAMVSQLIVYGADVNKMCPLTKQEGVRCALNGMTAAVACLMYDHVPCLDILQRSGVTWHGVASDGTTELQFAVMWGAIKCATYLIEELHCDIEATAHDGSTAIHYAARYDQLACARLLIRCGANIGPSAYGLTPFLLALRSGSNKVAALLLGGVSANTNDLNLEPDMDQADVDDADDAAETICPPPTAVPYEKALENVRVWMSPPNEAAAPPASAPPYEDALHTKAGSHPTEPTQPAGSSARESVSFLSRVRAWFCCSSSSSAVSR